MVKVVYVLLLFLGCAANASAQIVRGTVVDDSNNAPLQGVFIALIDSLGSHAGGTLSDAKGFYAIRAPYQGRFTLRAERIGHRSTTTQSFMITEDRAHTVDIRAPVAAIELESIDVRGARRCEVRREQGKRTAQLWEEARKALTVAGWVEKAKPVRFESRSWTRELDPYSLDIRNESVRYGITGVRPYQSIALDSLSRYGFVRFHGNDIVYYGPDAEVLLSDVFLEQHCFRSVVGSGENQGLAGLAFEPVATRQERDIAGTLWLDAKSLELRHIEYRYTNMPRTYNVKTLGGRTDFRKLPNGAWIVDRWYIRMPMTGISSGKNEVRLTAVREEGGEVVSIRDQNTSVRLIADGFVTGTVFDSVNHRPLTNATVYLSGTSYRAITDSTGRFAISDVPVGRYLATFTHPLLDSLPLFPQPHSVTVTRDDTIRVVLGTATVETLLRTKCGVTHGGTLFGRVSNTAGTAESDAEVKVTFKKYSSVDSGARTTTETAHYTVATDRAGQYVLCSLPSDERLTITVKAYGDLDATLVTTVEEKRFKRLDIKVK